MLTRSFKNSPTWSHWCFLDLRDRVFASHSFTVHPFCQRSFFSLKCYTLCRVLLLWRSYREIFYNDHLQKTTLSIDQAIYLSLYISTYPCITISIYPSITISIYPSIYLYLSIYQSILYCCRPRSRYRSCFLWTFFGPIVFEIWK